MNTETRSRQWIEQKKRAGWILLALGGVVLLAGIALQLLAKGLPFDARIVTGVGILLLGLGVANLVRYRAVRNDPQAASRLVNEERDERMRMIRAEAGSRAYWVSAVLVYAGLMWVSFASNGSLPALSEDALWFFLAGAVVLPFLVYLAGVVRGSQKG